MSDRETELQLLTAELQDREAIDDVFIAKSFTDRLIIVDIISSCEFPADVADCLLEHGFRSANQVYGDEGGSFAGTVGDVTRHHFVDVETRGTHQSYVVE